jgi:hypothetical protein
MKLPWVERRQEGRPLLTSFIYELTLGRKTTRRTTSRLPWVERRQEGRLSLWRPAQHTPLYPPSDFHTALKQERDFRQYRTY